MHPLDDAEIALKVAARDFRSKASYASGEEYAKADASWQALKDAARHYGETWNHYVAPPDEKSARIAPAARP